MRKTIKVFLFLFLLNMVACYNSYDLKDKKSENYIDKSHKSDLEISLSNETLTCLSCHKIQTPSIVLQWKSSPHYKNGIGCYECHQAEKKDIDAFYHNGFYIRVVLSPKTCGKCHVQEAKEFMASYHSKGGKFVESPKNVLGLLTTGVPNAFVGCARCHGSKVRLDAKGRPIAGTWPNQGIGRYNPDGTQGSCTACHYAHSFSLKQAREPKTCGRCHQGPDHPDIEIFELSKHGIAWEAHKSEIESKLDRKYLILGKDYYHAPACFTCHMGATVNGLKTTHDVGSRLSWNLRAPISKHTKNWKEKRSKMEKVCENCHSISWVKDFYKAFDAYVELYNKKFAIPAKQILTFLHKKGVLDAIPFNEQVEWDYWHLWHHEGRRGRQGTAMAAADYSHWQGIYLVAYNFYMKLLPHADQAVIKAYKEGKISRDVVKQWERFKFSILNSPEHAWFKRAQTFKDLEDLEKFYLRKYLNDMQNKTFE